MTLPIPTSSTTPWPTWVIVTRFNLLIATYKADSMFLINQSDAGFPLEDIVFRGGDSELVGEEWEISNLRTEQCVTVWKQEGNPKAPQGVECEIVGERLERSGKEKFWDSDFEVYYQDRLVGDCEKGQTRCELEISIPK